MQPMHSGEKSDMCNQCDYASSLASDLRSHLKTDIGEKCNHCNYTSFYARALVTHLKTHSGEKPNKCNQCGYACLDKTNLRKQMKAHSRDKSFWHFHFHPTSSKIDMDFLYVSAEWLPKRKHEVTMIAFV